MHKTAQYDYFCQKIGYSFNNPALLCEALTHRSHSAPHNERLEFLGDGVLNCAVAGMIFKHCPDLPEGDLSRLRANLVNQQALNELALDLNLGELIRFGEGEIKSGGNRRPSILSDALEAVLGAVYLDSDFSQAEAVVAKLYKPILDNLNQKTLSKDAKTVLQEYLQSYKLALPEYSIVTTVGKAHEKKFRVACVVSKFNIRALGDGNSRRGAEQAAAKEAYEQIDSKLENS